MNFISRVPDVWYGWAKMWSWCETVLSSLIKRPCYLLHKNLYAPQGKRVASRLALFIPKYFGFGGFFYKRAACERCKNSAREVSTSSQSQWFGSCICKNSLRLKPYCFNIKSHSVKLLFCSVTFSLLIIFANVFDTLIPLSNAFLFGEADAWRFKHFSATVVLKNKICNIWDV